MSPFKSSLAKTAKQLLGLRNTADLGLRGATQNQRTPPPSAAPFTANIVMMGGGGGGGSYQGGGGGGSRNASAADRCIGGAAGGYAKKLLDVSSISSATITVGAA